MDSLRSLLEEIKKIESVKKVTVISRTGIGVEGDEYENHDTFSAMSAILLGASETALVSLSKVKRVLVETENEEYLLVVPAGKRGLLAILCTEDIYPKIKHLLPEFEKFI